MLVYCKCLSARLPTFKKIPQHNETHVLRLATLNIIRDENKNPR